jgi:hypothetical protein
VERGGDNLHKASIFTNLDMVGHSEMEGSRCNVIMTKTCICAI